jgi:four helix bundle protein
MGGSAPNRDIEERTFAFAVRIVRLCRTLEKKGGVGKALTLQLLRSGTSVGANVQESRAAQSRADFIHKNSIALKEARETHFWLRLCRDAEIIEAKMLGDIIRESDELTRILGAIVVQSRRHRQSNNAPP